MSRTVVTTELVADQPVVVVIHHDQRYLSAFLEELSSKKIAVESYSVTEVLQSEVIKNRLFAAYKIAWLTETYNYLSSYSDLESVCSLLAEQQHKTTIVFPILTAYQEQVSGELPYAEQLFDAQEKAILFHNSYLPAATFLFGQDILDSASELGLLQLLSQDLHRGIVYGPTTQIHPQSLHSFCQRAVRYFLQPERTSVLIRGNSITGLEVATEIKQLYQSYHFSLIAIQEVVASIRQAVPFSVLENFVTDDPKPFISRFVQALPSPESLVKSPVWNSIFSVAETASYGEEVHSSIVEPSSKEQLDSADPELGEENKSEERPKLTVVDEPPVEPKATSRLSESTVNVAENEAETKKPAVQFNLNQEIQDIFTTSHTSHKQAQTKRIQQKKRVTTTTSKKRTAVFYGGLAFTGMGLGIVCLAVLFSFSVGMLKSAVTEYLVQSVSATENPPADTGQLDSINRLASVVGVQTDTYSMLLSLPALEDASSLVALSKQLNSVTDQTEQADQLAEMLYLQLIGLDSGDAVVTAQNLSTESLTAYETMAAFTAELQNTTTSLESSSMLQSSYKKFESDLATRKSGVQTLQQFSPLLPDIFGKNSKRTYAVVLQNNQELRPTGGFIEDVALLTFQNGSLISSSIFSGYEIDKKMSGEVIPPEEIKKYLNEQSWHFVDSNWNPHFPESADQIAWFIDKSLGITVDGVMTLDLDGLATILEATGPLDMPQYNEVLTHKNVLDRFEFHSEISLVTTSQDYRKEVYQAFIHKITNLPKEKIIPFYTALTKNVENQHTLVSFKSAEELNVSKSLGWSGSLLEPNCPSQLEAKVCEIDTAAQVEANVGINKANYYLKRSIDHTIALSATQAAHTRVITYENTAQTDSWPKGPYKAFVRVYVPSSASVTAVIINNTAVPANQVYLSQENNRKVFGFYVEVPVKKTAVVSLQYSVPYSKPAKEFSYTYFEQRQPGSGATPFTLTIKPEGTLKPSVIAPQATFEDNTIFFNQSDTGHGFYGVTFK